MNIFKRFKKSSSLRIVNLLGLSVMFACLLLSYSYIKQELSYDKYHANAGRMVRMSLQMNDDPVDGRVYGNAIDGILQQIPEIERVVKLSKVNTAVLTFNGEKQVVNNIYFAGSDFFNVFDVPLVRGEKDRVLQSSNRVVVSESFARRLLGDVSDTGLGVNGMYLSGRQIGDSVFFISGIFKDIPETSHFHTDMLIYRADNYEGMDYVYLLLKEPVDLRGLEQKITQFIEEKEIFKQEKAKALLMPVTDIHLHSHNLREMEPNGNINYIYLMIGANALLLIVVLFNLWLNTSLIFSYSRRYYQLIRMNGASSTAVVKDEASLALFLGLISAFVGILISYYVSSAGYFSISLSWMETGMLCLVFLFLILLISLFPVLKDISSTLFLNTNTDLKPVKFSYSNVKYMLTAQYIVVMIVVILAFGIGKQMNMVKSMQVGGNERNILVMREQPDQVQEKYALLKSELLKQSGIEAVTAAFELPGDAIRDYIKVRVENSDDKKDLPIMLVGEDFLPFFQISPMAGKLFSQDKFDYKTERTMLYDRFLEGKTTNAVEEYIINRKAMAVLGFASPEEAIGQTLRLEHDILDYVNRGVIVGVTDDFNYTGLYEASIPMLIMQRQMFLHCIMVRLDAARFQQSVEAFNKVWNEVNPDYPADYTFMNNVFSKVYRNELNAERLVYIFSLLCIIVADLGLIIFMAFIIRRRTKEIGIRKVNGASVWEIIRMLNLDFIRWIGLAFVIAAPVAYYVMHRWLENFAYRISLSWWLFALSGLAVLLISVISVSLQSWRAATSNPVDAIKSE